MCYIINIIPKWLDAISYRGDSMKLNILQAQQGTFRTVRMLCWPFKKNEHANAVHLKAASTNFAATRITKNLTVFPGSDMSSNHVPLSQPRASPAEPAPKHPRAAQAQPTTWLHPQSPEFTTVSIFRDFNSALQTNPIMPGLNLSWAETSININTIMVV